MSATNLPARREDVPADDIAEARAELAEAVARAEAVAAGQAAGTDLVPSRSNDPVEVKRQIAATQAEMRKTQEVVRKATAKLERTMKREMERAQAVLRPMEEAVRRLEQGIFSVNLYLGRDEEILLLRDGKSAPAEQPITLRQLLLYMDEEMAAAAPAGGISPTDIESFDEWLLANPAHLDQVLPETKGIVALRPRRKSPRHEGWRSAQEEEANRRTYWLVRNGERIYRVVTNLELEDRVLPYADEMERIFMRRRSGGRVEALRPGSHEWEKAQEAAEERERTYMRVGLVLEGLLHRTPIFHPLSENKHVSFLDPRCVREDTIRYITDAEGLLGTGHESFAVWRRRLAEELRPGMRIVLGPGIGQHDFERRQGNARLHPAIANKPTVGALYTVESRSVGRSDLYERERTQFVFRYREGARYVGDGAWGGGEYREPKKRASCTVYADDDFVLPFDLATVEEMERFLRSRTDRHHYEEMFPILKAAIAAKKREAEAEAPFRTMLAGVLARDNGVTVAEAEDAVDDLVSWWKLKNRIHRPLLLEAEKPDVAEEEAELRREMEDLGPRSRRRVAYEDSIRRLHAEADRDVEEQTERSQLAVRMIVAEHARRLKDERRPIDEKVIERLRAEHPAGRLVIARPRGRGYLVVVAAEPKRNVFVHEYEYSARGELKEAREWTFPRLTQVRTWRVIEQGDRWAAWDFGADPSRLLTVPEREELRQQAEAHFDTFGTALVLAVSRSGRYVIWTFEDRAKIDDEHLLTGELRGPKLVEHEAKWRRGDDGGVVLRWKEDRGNRISRHDGVMPWEKTVWRSHFDEDDSPPKREYRILRTDEKMLHELAREAKRYEDADRRSGEMGARTSVLVKSIESEWLRRAWAAERERFDADFGDPELWPAHREMKERDIRFPHTLSAYAGDSRSRVRLWTAVAHFVEAGEDPEGRTVGSVVDEANERWGEQWAAEDRWEREKRKQVEVADELRDYELTTYKFEHAADPEDEYDDEDDEASFDILAGVREMLTPEQEEVTEADFDLGEDDIEEDTD